VSGEEESKSDSLRLQALNRAGRKRSSERNRRKLNIERTQLEKGGFEM